MSGATDPDSFGKFELFLWKTCCKKNLNPTAYPFRRLATRTI